MSQNVLSPPNKALFDEIESVIELSTEPEVQQKLRMVQERLVDLEKYLLSTCSPETPLQIKIREDTLATNWVEYCEKGITLYPYRVVGLSGKVEGQFLRIIAEMTKAKRILEIGMFTGYSAVSFAQSPFAKEVVSLELDPYLEKFMRQRVTNPEVEGKIRVITGLGMNGLAKLKQEGKQFDLIFIDADKTNYINYYKYVMDNSLIDPAGAFLIDNTLWKGEVYPTGSSEFGKAFYEFNEFVRSDDRVIQVIVPLRDGITLIRPKRNGGIYGDIHEV